MFELISISLLSIWFWILNRSVYNERIFKKNGDVQTLNMSCTKNERISIINEENKEYVINWLLASLEPWSLAFDWKALGKSFEVGAVVVNHEIVLHPSKPISACSVKRLSLPCTLPRWASRRCSGWDAAGGGRWSSNTSISLEVSVRSSERSFSPICLHSPALCSPVVGIPQTRVNPHGLVFWEWNT